MKEHSDYYAEMQHLDYVLEYLQQYSQRVLKEKQNVDKELEYALKRFSPEDIDQYNNIIFNKTIQSGLDRKVKGMFRALKKPYFARVDFFPTKIQSDNGIALDGNSKAGHRDELYIGKISLIRDEDDYPLIVDWRAPISNLYYEGRLGEASYECPDGMIEGEITLKRQYIIEEAVMKDFFDIDITASDEFLQIALGSNKDKRLKDIVSTIQAEQNRIIRADMHKAIIVQGAAGGGKTTIALHRIAYLLYNYSDVLNPHNIMIMAPNRYFLSYISEVLPDLGVESVYQTTYADFAWDMLGKSLKLKKESDQLSYLIDHPNQLEDIRTISQLKSSMIFKELLDAYINFLLLDLIGDNDFMLGPYPLYKNSEIKELICHYYSYLPIEKRFVEAKKYLKNSLRKRKPEIIKEITNYYDGQVLQVKDKMPEDIPERRRIITELLDKRDDEIKFIQNKSKVILPSFFKKKLVEADQYYFQLFKNEKIFMDCAHGLIPYPDTLKLYAATSDTLKTRCLEAEDLAAVLYLHIQFYGCNGMDLKHIVIDEAQDIGIFQLYVLKMIMNTSSFTILGDLCQGIYSYKGISDWNDIVNEIFDIDSSEMLTIVQSYRTTVEIMDFANIAAKKLNLNAIELAKPVIRHGNEVRVHVKKSLADIAQAITEDIQALKKNGMKSIAVICKTFEECDLLKKLLDNHVEIHMLSGNEDEFAGGTQIMPVYLSKGLEFDGVIISNAGNQVYDMRDLDIKLLYIAMTRALHELIVYAENELTEILI